jgi:hypothetical protein
MCADHARSIFEEQDELNKESVCISIVSFDQICSYELTKEQHVIYNDFQMKIRITYKQKSILCTVGTTATVISGFVLCIQHDNNIYTISFFLTMVGIWYLYLTYLSWVLQQIDHELTTFLKKTN